jgi:polyisoprenoid-binding protein YceI
MIMKRLAIGLTTALALVAAPAIASASDWEIDPSHTTAEFAVRHMMVNTVKGQFGKVTGTVNLDDKDATKSKVEAVIDATTIDTREPKRDAHLKSPDFFDVGKYPTLSFKSTKIAKAGKGKYKATGDLTMHGVTKSVVLDVEGPTEPVKNLMGAWTRGAHVTGTLNRKDFGLNWNKALEAGGVLVGDEVKIEIDAELTSKAPASGGVATSAPIKGEAKAESKKN